MALPFSTFRCRRCSSPARTMGRAALALGFLALAGWATALARGQPVAASEPLPAGNGVWVARTWIGSAHTLDETRAFLGVLAARGFDYVFVHHTPMTVDGENPPEDPLQCRRLTHAAREISRRRGRTLYVMPWVGGRSTVRLDSAAQRRAFAAASARLVRDCGFPGLHVNIEPLGPGDARLFPWLRDLRAALGPDAFLSLSATRPHLWGGIDASPVPSWGADDFRRASRYVDQLAVMSYDTWLFGRGAYVAYLRRATRLVARAVQDGPNPRCSVLMGVPTYEERRAYFHPRAENMVSGLEGVRAGLSDLRAAGERPVGLAVYADWTTEPVEWAAYDAARTRATSARGG